MKCRQHYSSPNGFATVLTLLGMLLVVISLPIATKLVQQKQENRSNAAVDSTYDISCSSISCSTCGNPNDCSRVGCSWNGTACLIKSTDPTPTPSCSENSLKCAVTTQYKCINGKWENFKSCPSGCDGSSCKESISPPTSIPTSTSCSSTSCSTCGNPNDCSRVGCSWNGTAC